MNIQINPIKKIITVSLILISTQFIASCTSTEVLREVFDPKNLLSEKTKLDLKVKSSHDLNPDKNGRPSPVVVRLYSLVSPSNFENADFISLYQNEQEILGSDFLRREERNFEPSGQFKAQLEFTEKANFIGIMVAYQDIEQAKWRLVLPLEKGEHNYLSLSLTANSVLLDK
ncbi:MAG: type VI secretion system lipoprotein TssJ [Gammaproteobacteria bacterium]|nr:type VI secretion system lipoprotein TssJ [Gammaproteobacteria bacterium]